MEIRNTPTFLQPSSALSIHHFYLLSPLNSCYIMFLKWDCIPSTTFFNTNETVCGKLILQSNFSLLWFSQFSEQIWTHYPLSHQLKWWYYLLVVAWRRRIIFHIIYRAEHKWKYNASSSEIRNMCHYWCSNNCIFSKLTYWL